MILGLVLLLGIGMFLFAMCWDASDRARLTRRSDVAFWLHLLAAPMIAHPIFTLLGLTSGTVGVGEGLSVVGALCAFGLTALAVDRRALLVSALAYVLYALTELFQQFGAVELNVALTALVIGSALLLLSAYWHQARSADRRPLPGELQGQAAELDRPPCHPTSRIRRRSSGASTPRKVVAPLEHGAMLADQRERPLLQTKRGAFLDADLGPLAMAAESRENRHVGIDPQRIVAPVTGGHHPAVKVEDAAEFLAVERGDWAPVPGTGERRDDTQALFAFCCCGWRVVLSCLSSLRSSWISFSSSQSRALTGSTSSPHGVP